MIINKQKIREYDVNSYLHLVNPQDYTDPQPAGKSAHPLFAYISSTYSNLKICEFGCRWGSSCRIFGINPNNEVHGYDINEECIRICKETTKQDNVFFFKENILDNLKQLLYYDLIFIDLFDHKGIEEEKVYQFLTENKYKGITIWDDIGPDWPMNSWWNSLPVDGRFDLTDIGHAAGTGLIDFSGKIEIV